MELTREGGTTLSTPNLGPSPNGALIVDGYKGKSVAFLRLTIELDDDRFREGLEKYGKLDEGLDPRAEEDGYDDAGTFVCPTCEQTFDISLTETHPPKCPVSHVMALMFTNTNPACSIQLRSRRKRTSSAVSVKTRYQSAPVERRPSRTPHKRQRPPQQSSSDGEYDSQPRTTSSSGSSGRRLRSQSIASKVRLDNHQEEVDEEEEELPGLKDALKEWDVPSPTFGTGGGSEEEIDELEDDDDDVKDDGKEDGIGAASPEATASNTGPYKLRLRVPKGST